MNFSHKDSESFDRWLKVACNNCLEHRQNIKDDMWLDETSWSLVENYRLIIAVVLIRKYVVL